MAVPTETARCRREVHDSHSVLRPSPEVADVAFRDAENLGDQPDGHRNRQLLHHITTGVAQQLGNEFNGQLLGYSLPDIHCPLAEPRLDLLTQPRMFLTIGEHCERSRELQPGNPFGAGYLVGVAQRTSDIFQAAQDPGGPFRVVVHPATVVQRPVSVERLRGGGRIHRVVVGVHRTRPTRRTQPSDSSRCLEIEKDSAAKGPDDVADGHGLEVDWVRCPPSTTSQQVERRIQQA